MACGLEKGSQAVSPLPKRGGADTGLVIQTIVASSAAEKLREKTLGAERLLNSAKKSLLGLVAAEGGRAPVKLRREAPEHGAQGLVLRVKQGRRQRGGADVLLDGRVERFHLGFGTAGSPEDDR